MDETENSAAVLLTEQSVVVRQSAAVITYLPDKGFALLVVVMEMQLHIGGAEANNFSDAFEQFVPVLLKWIEQRVLRALARGIPGSILCDARPAFAPRRDFPKSLIGGAAPAQRLEMIGNHYPGALWLHRLHSLAQPVLKIRREPDFRVSRQFHQVDLPAMRVGAA
jgi:hypothetical protein